METSSLSLAAPRRSLAAVGDRLRRQLGALVPAPVNERLAALRRDLNIVTEGLAGRHPAPLVQRQFRGSSSTSVLTPRTLRIERVVRETKDAVTLWLRDPSGAPIPFVPGQFFTVIVTVDGQTVRRAYSACSSALDSSTVAITSKRVVGGRVSNYLNDQAEVGMTLSILGPSGNFTVAPDAERARSYVLIGGGSGITPLLAITQAVLHAEPRSSVSLIFGNRSAADIIFHGELQQLAVTHADRFVLRHVLQEAPANWTHGTGVLEQSVVERELAALDATRLHDATEYLLCGPAPMMTAARAALLARGIAATQVREERFGSPHLPGSSSGAPQSPATTIPQTADLHCADRLRTVTVHPGETLLEAGLRSGATMPFSCAMGGCGACKVKLKSGQVTLQEPNCLTAEEREGGYILACIASPCSPIAVQIS